MEGWALAGRDDGIDVLQHHRWQEQGHLLPVYGEDCRRGSDECERLQMP